MKLRKSTSPNLIYLDEKHVSYVSAYFYFEINNKDFCQKQEFKGESVKIKVNFSFVAYFHNIISMLCLCLPFFRIPISYISYRHGAAVAF